jgi:hypothetical protein
VRLTIAAVGVALALLVSGCSQGNETGAVPAGAGETGSGEAVATGSARPPRSAPTLPPTTPPSTTDSSAERARKAAEKLKKELAAARKNVRDVNGKSFFTMPRLVGHNLQAAQDELQSRGSFLLSQIDATGAGRRSIVDDGWKVCSQKPKAGVRVPKIQVVELKSVKLSESCP